MNAGDTERLVSDMQEALADPVFGATPPLSELRLAATNAPLLARAFLELYRSQRQSEERLAALDDSLIAAGGAVSGVTPSPWEEVRDFFHYCDNYIDAVDRDAERLALGRADPRQVHDQAETLLAGAGLSIRQGDLAAGALYRRQGSQIIFSATAPAETKSFQLLHLVALETRHDLLEATLDLARFRSETARDIARVGLANYFAGAALLPYGAFLDAAQQMRHDLERLSRSFGASIEQVAHRLSTLQRPGAKGIPFYFVRVDQAGTITKRHSSTRLQFARFGGACPLWNVHQAFETPGQFLRQLAQTPDGIRYLSLARDVSKSAGAFDQPIRRFAIGLGCEVSHIDKLVYADGLDPSDPHAYQQIGISCRTCPRTDCHQRSVPPLDRPVHIPRDRDGPLPYRISE